MEDLTINVAEIEALQTIGNTDELNRIFEKGKRCIVNGCTVVLARKQPGGSLEKFDALSTLEDFENYRKWVFKFL